MAIVREAARPALWLGVQALELDSLDRSLALYKLCASVSFPVQ